MHVCRFCGKEGAWPAVCMSTRDMEEKRSDDRCWQALMQCGGGEYSVNQRAASESKPTFQRRVVAWLMECFPMEVCRDRAERNHRFLEESLELVQSLGCTRDEAHQLVDYVFARPSGDPVQELGGVVVTIAALCWPNDLDMEAAAETELARIWKKIDVIRAKQATKPKHSPLPA